MRIVLSILDILIWLIIIDAVLSWVMPDKAQFPRNVTSTLTTPLYAPVRAILSPEKTGGIDFSPLVLILLIQVVRWMLTRATHAGGIG
jgi:YggT family protein